MKPTAEEIRRITRECKEEAMTMTREAYSLYDAIWTRRLRITPALMDHGRETVRDINQLMPNFLTHDPTAQPLDLLAEEFGFQTDSDLVEFLLAYKPRGPVYEKILASLLEECLAGADGTADVPF